MLKTEFENFNLFALLINKFMAVKPKVVRVEHWNDG